MTSVLRRYTPPTCTLEIAAKGSALSKWTDRAVLKNLRFQLSFDDPTVPEDKQVEIRGDRTQLEALWEAVSVYVQKILSQSDNLAFPLIQTSDQPGDQASSMANGSSEPALIEPAPLTLVPPLESSNSAMSHPATGIHLQPKGWLRHELHLGTIATDRSAGVVSLSALQLFDLANALDEYHAESLTLPTLNRPAWAKSPGGWASIAAVLLLAIGSTAALTKFVSDVSGPSPQVATATSPEAGGATAGAQSKSAERLPVPPGIEPLPSSLALQPLPPIPPAGATKSAAPPERTIVPQTPIPAPIAPGDFSSGQVAVIPQEALPAPNLSFESPDSAAIASAESARSAPSAALPESAALRPEAMQSDALPSDSVQSGAEAANGTAFDAIPQVAEVRNYFQSSWQAPEGLTQTLEYRLVLNSDGSLQRIIPLGQAAATFLDRTNMPLLNEPFVSPVENGTPQIRLVLGQDGKVQTFLEGVR
ncbi:MAG: DUF4335 domain-containing protein [Oscillatoriophycideae cyanobacterium NC_groundwater_1537_Pr4_S-0.65um_50_18]|nr:DUF4335 domain-containing protein [Oscillatoriophycideae cyanobacterium NC_groundwater_1537_Pr4_S-0.65um_50_18]